MKKKIHNSMMLVIGSTLGLTFLLMVVVFYVYSLASMKEGVKQEAAYVEAALNSFGTGYLEEIDHVGNGTRLTLIDSEGAVLYDSIEEQDQLENHAGRKEIKDAFLYGHGETVRNSATVGKTTYYYAVQLENGAVLRVSRTLDYLIPILLGVLPLFILTYLLLMAGAYVFAEWRTKQLIRPINELDLEHPLENQVYEELTPLLVNMDNYQKAKEEVANMRKEFSANVSHELRTPLTSISGYAEIMKSGLVKPEDMTRFSEKIYKEARRLLKLVEDIMNLSKLDEKQLGLEKEEVDLYEMACEICNRLNLLAEAKKVKLHMTGQRVMIFGVKQVLDEMIYNVVENAIKYNVDGGTVDIWLGDTLEGKQIVVEDTGIGIPKEDQERIFERFYRVDKSHSKETGGTGLGLSIVKHAALLHHAEITVHSQMGKGTRMEILFLP